jgi:rhomboid protease GluP
VDVRSPRDILGGLIPASRFTTSIILLVNIGVFIATNWGQWGMLLMRLAQKDSRAILQGHEWWRLITAGFLHGGIWHIGMNMWVLNDLGAEVERVFGTARFICFYLIATVAGFLLSSYWTAAPSVGASAGLFGLIGAMIAFGVRNRTEVGRQIRAFYLKWALYGLVMGFLPFFRIDNAAHLGGLAAGFAVAYVAGTAAHSSRAAERVWQALAIACVLVTIYSFWIVYTEFLQIRAYIPEQA